jgi:hypothetical protein
MFSRRRVGPTSSLKERLTAWAKEAREQAEKLPPGNEREALLRKAREAHVAANIDGWANSPGLRPPD